MSGKKFLQIVSNVHLFRPTMPEIVYGGVYVDLDLVPQEPFDALALADRDFLWTFDHNYWAHGAKYCSEQPIFNGFLASRPGHAIWPQLMDFIMYTYEPDGLIMCSTGPVALGRFARICGLFNDPSLWGSRCLALSSNTEDPRCKGALKVLRNDEGFLESSWLISTGALPWLKAKLADHHRTVIALLMIIGVYVINLDKDAERLRRVLPELKKLRLPVKRVPGVNGKSLDARELGKMSTWFCRNFCTPGMVGCAASHLKTWKAFLASDWDLAVVCEDDVRLAGDCRKRLEAVLVEVPEDFDLLYGGCLHCHPDGAEQSWSSFFFNVATAGKMYNAKHRVLSKNLYVPKVALGTHCYVVSRKGAKRLVELMDGRINYHVDVQMNHAG
ncbi:hypothetical protein HK104_002510 [Borealophlyctis nickersoniae]|nr:hypothetical protein HK104_002510 [Borealophlyctis nickersoniae]